MTFKIIHNCQALFHDEDSLPMCFYYGTACTYIDPNGCEKNRELQIKEAQRLTALGETHTHIPSRNYHNLPPELRKQVDIVESQLVRQMGEQ